MADDKRGLTVYLIKANQASDFEKTLMSPAGGALPLSPPLDGAFRAFPPDQKEPSWVAAVRTLLPAGRLGELISGVAGGLLYLRRPGGHFVIPFGLAWTRLKEKWLEADFGKRVALNSIAKDQILEIRAEQFFAKFHIANERAPRAAQVDDFSLDPGRDVVASIEGLSVDVAAGGPIRGATSLRMNTTITDLPDELDKAAKLFKSNAYTKNWPEIDNIVAVADPALDAELDQTLNAVLIKSTGDSEIALFSPSFKRAESLDEQWYSFGRRSSNAVTYPTLRFADWFNMLKAGKRKPSVEEAREYVVHLLDGDKEPKRKTTVYDCFAWEATLHGKPYILAAGRWYEVIAKFRERTQNALDAIPGLKRHVPKWKIVGGEPAYNQECAALPGMLHFDAKPLMYGGGKGKFEFCDFMHPEEQTLFFVKNCSKSAGMSHLSEQVRRTAELLFNTDGEYREELYEMYKKKTSAAAAHWLKTRPKNGDWKLCLVSLGRKKQDLPFFAKCTLVNLYKHLSERGHLMYFISA
jgi:uncharacterized protein (TIGR04141 family)